MTITNRFALVLALALGATLAGCGSDPSMQGDDDGGGGNHPIPLDATGTYKVHSTFDLATNVPGTAGTVVNTIIAATDNPDDPTRWVVDQLIAQITDETVKSVLNSFAKEIVISWVDQAFDRNAPGAVLDVKQALQDLGDMAKHFRLDETLQITKVGNDYTAVHSLVGVHYKLGNQEGDLLLVNARLTNVVVENVGVTMDQTGQFTIAAHSIAVPYGKMLRLGLDGAVIPLIDSSAHNLNDLLKNKINCATVAKAIADQIQFGEGVLTTACNVGLTAGANYLYSKMDAIDAGLQFSINGTAHAIDTNADHKVDTIQFGNWSGTLSYGSTPTPLLPATFTGERM